MLVAGSAVPVFASLSMVGVIRHGSKVGLSQHVSGFCSDNEQLRIEVALARRDDAFAALFEVGSRAGLWPGSGRILPPPLWFGEAPT